MNSRRRPIRLTFPASGESVLAKLLDAEALNVCKLVWKMFQLRP
jgi:hypothetical protein